MLGKHLVANGRVAGRQLADVYVHKQSFPLETWLCAGAGLAL